MLHSGSHMKRTVRNHRMHAITLTAQVWKEDHTYIAHTPELDVSSCGPTLARAKKALREAVSLFLEDAAKREVLGDILSEAGYERRGNTYRPRRVLASERVRLPLPRAS
jgi:predicted RNase H-like HicB family nuclease